MNDNFILLNKCLCCSSPTLVPILNLGKQPLANSYHTKDEILTSYPLGVNLCPQCFHVQQFGAVNPDLMFKNYAYVSGTSKTLLKYFSWFAKKVTSEYFPTLQAGKILDIACNDGSQLASFKTEGWNIFGVDPAENLLKDAQKTGATVYCSYWDAGTASKFNTKFDCLIAQNVFAHTASPLEFLQTCKSVMHNGSKLFIQTSQSDMFSRGEFDTIYHEHISFFSAQSLKKLAERADLVVQDVFITPIHGNSYVFVLGLEGDSALVDAFIEKEQNDKRYEVATYSDFAKKALDCVQNLKSKLETYRDSYKIVGYGAAAKGNTLLNFGNITLDYIVDDNPLKQNLYTPGMNIPIFSKEQLLKEKEPIVLVPLAWNFYDEIRKNVKSLRPGIADIFITYFPELSVHS